MSAGNYFLSKNTIEPDQKMSVRREFLCGQVFGVLLFCVGFVGGILIGIYVYHGGPDSEVTCKNLPTWLKNGDKTTESAQTKFTTTMPTTEVTEMKKKEFTYAINNQIQEPYFNINDTMDIEKHRHLLYYMEKAVDKDPKVFTGFKTTYFSKLGYFIDSINNVAGNYAEDKTYWQISNTSGPLAVEPDQKMSVRREFICGQVFGVLLFCVGFVGGILIGIYVYHGGPDSEVTCKNLPTWLKDGDKTTESAQTKFTTTMPTSEVTEMKKKEFTYAINNQIQEPYFNINDTMDIEKHRPLLYYMEKAVDKDPKVFTGFKTTYFSKLGYFIDSINNVAGNYAEDKTYWQISNTSGPLAVGVSTYIPMAGDIVLFNFIVYANNTQL